MRYPPHILDEIRARLPVSAVVGRTVRLKKAGREWKGLSPFNAEKTPSFYANDAKGRWFDFSAGKDGDIFNFLMETQGLSFPDAVERLAGEAGVELPRATPEAAAVESRRRTLHEVVEIACRFYERHLAGPSGQAARDYLDRRAVQPATRAEFRLGYAPAARDALRQHLRDQGIEDGLGVAAGLLIRPDDGREPYDRFRGRVLFPIGDRQGRPVGFGGRALADDVQPKYLNSPESELFDKGSLVFNAHRAAAGARKDQPLAVVEGYLDAISVWQAGHKAVVATLGTAFTEGQIRLLWRIDPEPVLCYDGDRAGRAAAFRALDRMLPQLEVSRSFRFAFLPDGQDPDDLVRAGGLDAWTRILAGAQKLWDVLWNREVAAADTTTPDGVASLEAGLKSLVGGIGDAQLRQRYLLTIRISVGELAWREIRQRFRAPRGEAPGNAVSLLRTSGMVAGRVEHGVEWERLFLGLSIAFPDMAAACESEIHRLRFRGGTPGPGSYQAFADTLMHMVHEADEPLSPGLVYDRLGPAFWETMDELYGRADDPRPAGHALARRFPAYGFVRDSAYFDRCYWVFLQLLIAREIGDEITAEIGRADDLDAADRIGHMRAHYNEVVEAARGEERDLEQLANEYRPKRKAAA